MTHQWTSRILSAALLGSLVFIGAACTRSRTDGGVYFSNDNGTTWSPRTTLSQDNRDGTIAGYDITEMTIDPTNPSRIYAGTWNNGALISEDSGEHWKSFIKNRGTVRSILVSPRDAHVIYAALPDQVGRSDDGGNQWKEILPVSGKDVMLQSMSLGGTDGRVLYVGLSNGDLLRSDTRGESWTRMYTFDQRIERILANRNDANIVYAATTRNALWRSADSGKSWTRFLSHAAWEDLEYVRSYRTMALDPTIFDGLVYVSASGIIRTHDGGITWDRIEGLESPGNVTISALAVHPKDASTLLYGTRQGIFRTTDGGNSWKTTSLNSSRAPVSITFNDTNPTMLFVGLAK